MRKALSTVTAIVAGWRKAGLVLTCLAALALGLSGTAEAHTGGTMTTRYQAEWEVRDIMSQEYGWYVSNVRCGSSTWTVGIHFPCTFTRLGSRYRVCYHSIDYDYGDVAPYRSWSCKRWY